ARIHGPTACHKGRRPVTNCMPATCSTVVEGCRAPEGAEWVGEEEYGLLYFSAVPVAFGKRFRVRVADALSRGGLFVPKPRPWVSVLGNPVFSLGLSVRQRPLVCMGMCRDRHSVGHSAQLPGVQRLSVNGRFRHSRGAGSRGAISQRASCLE